MARTLKNRVRETTASTGAGAITPNGAVLRFRTFASAGLSTNATVPYLIEVPSGPWEIGTGTYTATGTIQRTFEDSSTGAILTLTGEAGTTISLVASSAALAELTPVTVPARIPVTTIAASGSSVALTLPATGSITYDITLTAACTLTLVGGTNGEEQRIRVYLRQDATAGRVVTLPTNVQGWAGGTVPTPNTVGGRIDVFQFTTPDGGVTWLGDF